MTIPLSMVTVGFDASRGAAFTCDQQARARRGVERNIMGVVGVAAAPSRHIISIYICTYIPDSMPPR
jgi:hypothetical protein